MGSACCVAARERTNPNTSGGETWCRNVVYSPSWSFQWDNGGRVDGDIDPPSYRASHGIGRNAHMELKWALISQRGNSSELGSPLENFGSPTSEKSPVHEGILDETLTTTSSDLSTASNNFQDVKNLAKSSGIADSLPVLCSPSIDLQSCGICSKVLTSCSSDISVIAVLVCGHVYHAECLETMTLEADRYDPACPICMVGKQQVSKASRTEADLKAKKIHKISKDRVLDSYLDGGYDHKKITDRRGKVFKIEPISSTRNSPAKPFLKLHLSLGSRWSRSSLSERDSARKRGFWAR